MTRIGRTPSSSHPSARFKGLPDAAESGSGQDGFTLIETLIAMTLMLVVFSAVVITLVVFNNQSNQTTSKVSALDAANIGIERIARDIRQATMSTSAGYTLGVTGSTTLSLYLEERPGGTGSVALHKVTYTCGADAAPSIYDNCTRTDTTCATLPCTAGAPAANVSSTAKLIDGLTSSAVFSAVGPTPTTGGPMLSSVQVTLAPAISGSTLPAVVQETVVPRNCQIGGC